MYSHIFSSCRRILEKQSWGRIQAALDKSTEIHQFPDQLASLKSKLGLPDFIGDLARIEWIRHQAKKAAPLPNALPEKLTVNAGLTLVPVAFKGLAELIINGNEKTVSLPEPSNSHVIIWPHPNTHEIKIKDAEDIDLLALKIIIEGIDPRQAAAAGGINVRAIHTALDRAAKQGLLVSPPSGIRRSIPDEAPAPENIGSFLSADIFTLQWHVTQACDLHCRHCYDRSDRSSMPFDMAVSILDDFFEFCRHMHVNGQVSFTGGNPLLYPRFTEIYREAVDRGFGVGILGNPGPPKQIEKLLEIEKPLFFQISLEGLAEYNDYIRGNGHFQRSLDFLDDLNAIGIYSMVMLTLTRDNLEQVLPLSRVLDGRTNHFTFNRLSTVGEGKQLLMPKTGRFRTFLTEYAAAAADNPLLGLKDNLFNICLREQGLDVFGGCTGYGCGAAFNFLALLPDGEVHACRKFPSPLGNISLNRLVDIYQSDLAKKYRAGSEACAGCVLNPVCRGCLAVTYSYGLNIFKDRDPFCFYSESSLNESDGPLI